MEARVKKEGCRTVGYFSVDIVFGVYEFSTKLGDGLVATIQPLGGDRTLFNATLVCRRA